MIQGVRSASMVLKLWKLTSTQLVNLKEIYFIILKFKIKTGKFPSTKLNLFCTFIFHSTAVKDTVIRKYTGGGLNNCRGLKTPWKLGLGKVLLTNGGFWKLREVSVNEWEQLLIFKTLTEWISHFWKKS